MAIEATSTATGATRSSGTGNSYANGNTIAENFDAFLQLLTTQLQNQNPLDPLDTNQFMQELVQFSSVEQQLKTNDYMEKLLATLSGQANSAVVSYLGKTVTADNSTAEYSNGSAEWNFDLARGAETITVSVRDRDGTVVYEERLAGGEAGTYTFTWDGTTSDGKTATNGNYTISIDARDEDGNKVDASTDFTGTVTEIDLSGDEPMVSIEGKWVKLSSIRSIATSQSGTDANAG